MSSADSDVFSRIKVLVDEEHQLRESGGDDADLSRIRHLEEELDQCWDLLRQRRARREAGEDPAAAEVRDVDTVERYQQ